MAAFHRAKFYSNEMTLFTFNDTTLVLEKVCAYEYVRPQQGRGGATTGPAILRIMLEGSHQIDVTSEVAISSFLKAMKELGEKV